MAILLPDDETEAATQALIDGYQRDFPIVARPYAEIAAKLALTEDDVLARLRALSARGALSRVGAVVRPHSAGRSTLAAVAAPRERIEAVAAQIDAYQGVNHNYEREGAWNLWFVVTGADQADVDATLAGVARDTGLHVLDLPLEKSYHIDLGFALFGGAREKQIPRARATVNAARGFADTQDKRILAALETGLPLEALPFSAVARSANMPDVEVLDRVGAMIARGVITRFGLVVRHRAFGFTENAMAVWDVEDCAVDDIGEAFAREPGVTLCYRRPRRPPLWRYNLFTMVHGRHRREALAVVERIAAAGAGAVRAHDLLFSLRCFKQRGAVFSRREAAD